MHLVGDGAPPGSRLVASFKSARQRPRNNLKVHFHPVTLRPFED